MTQKSMRRTKNEKKKEKQKKQEKTKTKKRKEKTTKNMLCYKKRTPKFQELGTVPLIGPLAHQLWFFGVKKRAN